MHISVHEDPFIRNFSVSGVSYRFMAFIGGPVSFLIVGGSTLRKAYVPPPNEWCDDDVLDHHGLTDPGYFTNAMPIIRQVRTLISTWIRQEKPYLFHFHATDERKHRLYQRLVVLHAGALANYNHYMCGKEFCFVRKTG